MSATSLTVAGARGEDAGRGIARLDPADLAALEAPPGALLAITLRRTAYARAMPLPPGRRDGGVVQIDGAIRGNAGAAIGDAVTVAAVPDAAPAREVRLAGAAARLPDAVLRRALAGLPLAEGDHLRLPLVGGREVDLTVAALDPAGPAWITADTRLTREPPARRPAASASSGPAAGGSSASAAGRSAGASLRYEDLGGLGPVVARIREVVELPLRNRAAFDHLGITPPRGVLLVGPPGTGKTMIARAVAAESGAHFIAVNGPEIVDRYYGASEQQLRAHFETARRHAPAIIFIDEIDAIAPKREALSGEKQVERRIVAQLLTLMDGLADRGDVVVLAATNLPDSLDPALRRPGRFDREIRVDPPDRAGRREILAVHSRAMPLGADVDLDTLAAATHGHVGADLAALCREAGVAALRRGGPGGAAPVPLEALRVEAADFAAALKLVTPTALREVFVEVPDVRWSDVAGADRVRDALVRAVHWPLTRPELFARLGVRPPRGVLLHGRPGTGKTLLARALATESGVGFIAIRGAELLREWQGASERALREVFARARMAAPCIVFFDEIDAIAGRRGGGDGATVERMVAQLLTEMDGIADPAGVVVLGATNRLDRLDPALLRPGRFDLVIAMPVPDAAERAELFRLHSRKMPLAAAVDAAALAAASVGLVGADIAGICRLAALEALGRAVAGLADAARVQVEAADFTAALAAFQEARNWPTTQPA